MFFLLFIVLLACPRNRMQITGLLSVRLPCTELCTFTPLSKHGMILSLIAAVDRKLGIGKDNKLLWHLPADLKYFKRVTSGHTVIMGRKTFESIGRALPGRRNIVLTRQEDFEAPGCEVMEDLFEAIRSCGKEGEVFVIGGAEIYRQAMQVADKIYLTRVDVEAEADSFFPEISLSAWKLVYLLKNKADEQNAWDYSFSIYQRVA